MPLVHQSTDTIDLLSLFHCTLLVITVCKWTSSTQKLSLALHQQSLPAKCPYLKILKSSKSLTSSSRNSSPPLLEFHLVRNQLPASRNLSQYLGGELFFNLHLNFPISFYLQFLGRTNWSLEFPSPLKFPSNSIKASTLVTIKPWSEPPEREQVDIVFEKKLGARVLQITRREPGSGEGSREQNILTSCPSRPPLLPIITNPVHN